MNQAPSGGDGSHLESGAESEGAPAPVTYSLQVLSTSPDEARRTVLFRRVGEGEAIEISAEIDSPNLLAQLPALLEAALEIQKALWPAQRTLSRLPSSFFPRLADESRLLRRLAGGGPARGDVEAREARILRDVAWEALRAVIDPARRAEVDALAPARGALSGESTEELARSLDRVAALLDRLLADPRDAAILAVTDLDAAYALALRRYAEALRAPEREPTPARARRGGVRLIGAAYRALRTGAFMAVPCLPDQMG